MVRSAPVSSQKAQMRGETFTSSPSFAGHTHFHPLAALPTHYSMWEYAMYQCGSPTFSATSSLVINCPTLKTMGAGGQASSPCTHRLHLHAMRRCLANARAQHKGGDQLVPRHLIICDVLNHQLQPAADPPLWINSFQCLLLFLPNIHLVIWLPARASPGGFHPLCGQFSVAALLLKNNPADRRVSGFGNCNCTHPHHLARSGPFPRRSDWTGHMMGC